MKKFDSAAHPARRHRILSWLLMAANLAPAALLLCALHENAAASRQFGDVNRSGSLRFRSYRLYGLTCRQENGSPGGASEVSKDLAAMAEIRADLRARYPDAVAGTDPAWSAFSGQLTRTGQVAWNVARSMALASDRLTGAIEARSRLQEARVSLILDVGLLGLCVSLLGTFLLIQSLVTTQQKQRRLTAILDTTPDLIGMADATGRIIYFNGAFRRFLGLAQETDLSSLRVADVHVAWSRERLRTEAWPSALRDGSWQGETAFRAADGREVPMSQLVLTHRGENGALEYLSTIARDITARKEADDALALAQSRLRTVVENAPLILYSLDANGVYTALEGKGLEALELSPGEVIGQSVFDLAGGDPLVEGYLRMALLGDAVAFRSERAGTIWENQCLPLRGEGGETQGIIGLALDVTSQARAEDALRRSEDRLRRLHDLATARRLTLVQKMDGLLEMGRQFFDLEIGFVSRAQNGKFSVLRSNFSEEVLALGFTCDLPNTYCARVVATGQTQAIAHAAESEWRRLPAYAAFGLESYLGAPLWIGDALCGTLCFAGRTPRLEPFPESDLEILRLMAQWLGGEMAREEDRERIESYSVVLEYQMGELEKANRELEALATLDGLTGIRNHRAFQERLAEEVIRATRYGTPLSLIMLDVDQFKQFNDTFGHPEGDRVLKKVARLLEKSARATDLAARYGGEEFALLLPETDSRGANVIAQRIRRTIEAASWPRRDVTASLGVAALTPDMDDGGDLIAAADLALYQSKTGGRNQVTLARRSADSQKPPHPLSSPAIG